jgi:predicted O-methyltransferase YrrM
MNLLPLTGRNLRRNAASAPEDNVTSDGAEDAALKQRTYVSLSRLYTRMLGQRADVGSLFSSKVTPHFESWIEFDKLGSPAAYKKTHDFVGEFINDDHRFYSTCPTGRMAIPVCIDVGIDGYLQRGDALKLYELAYFCEGEILELGTHKGLSTSILAQSRYESRRTAVIETVDIDPGTNLIARANLKGRPGSDIVRFNVEDAVAFMRRAQAEGRRFDFIFIDHWHGYDATYEATTLAVDLLSDGGFVLFHDYNDPSNYDPQHVYGVYQAVADTLLGAPDFLFYGNFGCCALFRKLPPHQTTKADASSQHGEISSDVLQRSDLVRDATPAASYFTVPLVELGAEDKKYDGVFCPEPELGRPKLGVSELLLSGAEQYYRNYQQFDTIFALIDIELRTIHYKPAGVAVDFGSGFGNTVIPLLEHFPELRIVATDISPDLLAILRREALKRNVAERCTLVAMDAQRDYFEPGFADCVFGGAVLHHLVDPGSLIRTAVKVLKPGGHAIFLEPFENGHAILRLAYGEILDEAKRRGKSGPGFDYLAELSKDIAVRTHRRAYPGWSEQWSTIDDKWLFTRTFFDAIRQSVGASDLRIRPLHDTVAPFTSHSIKVFTEYRKLPCPDALPSWAWDILQRYDQDAFSPDMKRDLVIEGAVVITK